MSICNICGNEANTTKGLDPLDNNVSVNCKICGEYILTDSFTIDENIDKLNFYKVSSWIREQNDLFNNVPKISSDKFDSLIMMKEKRIQDKLELMMLFINKFKDIKNKKIYSICWLKNEEERDILLDELVKKELIVAPRQTTKYGSDPWHIFRNITFAGLQYIENIDEPNKASKNIFVAFNFEEGLNEIFSTYVKQGIEELGFNYVVVNQDTTEHDRAISDEIIAKLKSSRIVIADFTNHRNSVYFEAGFAMGMKIPIIWTCQEGHTEELSFDTRQYPHLVWSDGEDLKEQIMNRIKVII